MLLTRDRPVRPGAAGPHRLRPRGQRLAADHRGDGAGGRCGLPMLPDDLPGTRRELVMMAGRARYFKAARMMAGAQNAFELLAPRYPDTPNVHYAYGVFLLAEQPEQGHRAVPARAEGVAAERPRQAPDRVRAHPARRVRRGDALGASRRSTKRRRSSSPATRSARCCSRPATSTGAIRELEAGVKLAPDSPVMHFTLARAYRRAGRGADAERRSRPSSPVSNRLHPRERRPARIRSAASRSKRHPGAHAPHRPHVVRRALRRLLASPWRSPPATSRWPAQQPPAAARHRGRRDDVTAIVVDVVVRDGRASPSPI